MDRAVDPQHQHVTGGRVGTGVGPHSVEHPIATGTELLAHAWMHANRPATRILLELPDVGPNYGQLAGRRLSRAGLGQPAARGVEIVEGFFGVAEPSRQLAAQSAARAASTTLAQAPSAWTTRQPMMPGTLPAIAQPAEPTTNSTNPAATGRRRP